MKLGESEVEVATRDGKGKNLVKHWIGYIRTAVGNRTVSSVMLALLSSLALFAQSEIPEWCRALPRREYKALERVAVSDTWFEVYKVAPGVFAIYEPHQSEETISYLIVGNKRALLFDTGLGIGNLRRTTSELTRLPIMVLNSHTHNDHVGDNWQFDSVYGMDTEFTRTNAKGSRQDAQSEIAPAEICGKLPNGFDPKTYLLDRANGLLFTGDTYYPATIWLYRPETDLDAYSTSIRRLAALSSQIRIVLGAHNVPVAKPEVLSQLVTGFEAVRAGKVAPIPGSPGQVIYKVDSFAFRMRAPESRQ
jgi:glyoxylase-like metal-dependent hydrolase (beta-lactamase superfamily II)